MTICSLLALGITAAFSLTGCGTINLHGDASARVDRVLLARKPSSLAGWQDEKSARWNILKATEARAALLLVGWERIAVESAPLSGRTISYNLTLRGTQHRSIGSAVPVTSDGYFLTAAHCVDEPEPPTLVALTRKLRIVKTTARVVWTSGSKRGGADLALIHAPIEPAAPFSLSDLQALSSHEPVAIAGWSSLATKTPASSVAAGQIVAISPVRREVSGFTGWAVEHDVPLNQGDSGGPLITQHGRLAGINSEVRLSPLASLRLLAGWVSAVDQPLAGYTAKAFAPDREWLQRTIDADRAAHRTTTPVRKRSP